MLSVLSLGWGVQSWTIAAMSALGELPKVDVALHSDTTWEAQATYAFARVWTPWLEAHGVKVVTVSEARQARRVVTGQTDIPAFTLNQKGDLGQLRRQCTQRWKVAPIRRFIRAVQRGCTTYPLETRFVLAWRYRVPVFDYLRICNTVQPFTQVQQWLGISLDEVERVKDSDVKYITNHYPLLDKHMRRADCVSWLLAHNLPVPPKSACVFCPYHNLAAWQALKREGSADWQQAVRVDTAIRDQRPPYPLFIHPARKPLEEAVTISEDFGFEQLSLVDTDNAPCDSGYCFL